MSVSKADVKSFDAVLRRVWFEPKFRAQVQWFSEFGAGAQLSGQVPREELEAYVTTGKHPNPHRSVSIVFHEMPDWDWWEPRHDQLWRRQALGVWS